MSHKCPDAKKLSSYMDAELSETESLQIRTHVQTCRTCQDELSRMRFADRMISSIPDMEPSPGFDAVFWEKINVQKEKKKKLWSWQEAFAWGFKPRMAAAVLAAMMGLVMIWYVGKRAAPISPQELAIAKDLYFYKDLDMIMQLDILENWDTITAADEQN